jgi:hypothetical protein
LLNCRSTACRYGIDLEPNRVEDRLEQIVIKNCSFLGNVGGGIAFALHKLADFGVPPIHETSISVSDCTVDGTGPVVRQEGHRSVPGLGPVTQVGLLVSGGAYAPNAAGLTRLGAMGYVSIVNVSVANTLEEGVRVEGKAKGSGLALTVCDIVLNTTAHYDAGLGNKASKDLNPISIIRAVGIDTGGAVRFERCSVADDRQRDFFSTGSSESHRDRGGLADVHGNFTVINPFGCTVSLGTGAVDVEVELIKCIE